MIQPDYNLEGVLRFCVKASNMWGYHPTNLAELLSIWRSAHFGTVSLPLDFEKQVKKVEKSVRKMLKNMAEMGLNPMPLDHPYSL